MIRRPPRSTLFPSRRSSDLTGSSRPDRGAKPPPCADGQIGCRVRRIAEPRRERSEEHTSELQSPCNLVCRLLLEKKKNISDGLTGCFDPAATVGITTDADAD